MNKSRWIWSVIGLCVAVSLISPGCSSKQNKPHSLEFHSGVLHPKSSTGVSGWKLVGKVRDSLLNAGEGVASITQASGKQSIITRGITTIPAQEKSQGWTHIGDPDGFYKSGIGEFIVDNFQGPSTRGEKLYLVTKPTGSTLQYIHHDVKGELYNNSFDSISPNSQWMISGTWTTERTLEIYPTPYLDSSTSPNGGNLKIAGYIKLDHSLYDVQGCDFISDVQLICLSTSSTSTSSNLKGVFQVTLTISIDGKSVTGHVSDLGSLPQVSSCKGTFEAEGIDFDAKTGILRAEILQPGDCVYSTIYEYKKEGSK